jgi:hypothetical protein
MKISIKGVVSNLELGKVQDGCEKVTFSPRTKDTKRPNAQPAPQKKDKKL